MEVPEVEPTNFPVVVPSNGPPPTERVPQFAKALPVQLLAVGADPACNAPSLSIALVADVPPKVTIPTLGLPIVVFCPVAPGLVDQPKALPGLMDTENPILAPNPNPSKAKFVLYWEKEMPVPV